MNRRFSSCLVGIFFLFSSSIVGGEGFDSTFAKANDFYNKGNFKKSIELYRELLDETAESGEIFYNLGNSYFKSERLAEAIFYYKAAEKWMPRDSDLQYNLKYARSLVQDKVEDHRSFILKKIILLSELEWLFVFVLVWVIFWGSFFFDLFYPRIYFRWLKTVGIICLAGILPLFVQFKFLKKEMGVIKGTNIKIYSGPGLSHIVLYSLNEGTEFNILKIIDEKWILLELYDGKKGHLKRSQGIM